MHSLSKKICSLIISRALIFSTDHHDVCCCCNFKCCLPHKMDALALGIICHRKRKGKATESLFLESRCYCTPSHPFNPFHMAVSTALSSGFELIGLWPDDGSTGTRKSGSRNILRIFQGRTQWIPVSGRKYGIVRIDLARCDRE